MANTGVFTHKPAAGTTWFKVRELSCGICSVTNTQEANYEGICFKTPSQAAEYAKAMQTFTQLRLQSEVVHAEFEAQHTIMYSRTDGVEVGACEYYKHQMCPVFATAEDATAVMHRIGVHKLRQMFRVLGGFEDA